MKTKNIKEMVVVRGCQPRMSEVNFYSLFQKMSVKFVGDKATGWIQENKIPQNIEFIQSPLYPVWGFDPWTQFFGVRESHRSFQFVSDLEKYLKDADVINISDLFYFYCWQSAQLAKKLHKKLAVVVWESIPKHISTYVPPYYFGIRKVLQTADLFIARSRGANEYLVSLGVSQNKIKLIYKGIDVEKFIPTKRKPKEISILYVGQMVKEKGVLDLIAAFKKLVLEFPDLKLHLVAKSKTDALIEEIRQLAKVLPIKLDIEVSYGKLPVIYQTASIYCQLSQKWKYLNFIPGGHEHFSYAVLEAMASGLPIVATNIGSMPEQLGANKGNIFVKPKNTEEIYQALKILIKDKTRRGKAGITNRIRAKKIFNFKVQAKKTEKAILDIL